MTCNINGLSISEGQLVAASQQNLQNLFHGWPRKRLYASTTESEFENTAHGIQVTVFIDLLIQCISYKFVFLNVSPCPLYKRCMLITIICFPSCCQLQKDNPKTININLLVHSCLPSIFCRFKLTTTRSNKNSMKGIMRNYI